MIRDLVISGSEVIDGSGSPRLRADVGIRDGVIRSIAPVLFRHPSRRRIDAAGLVLGPGFVDMHTHSDIQLLSEPAHEAKVMPGVTLEVLGLGRMGWGLLRLTMRASK